MQRMNDHNRVEKFLTTQMLNVTFSLLSFIVFGCVLLGYNIFYIPDLSHRKHTVWYMDRYIFEKKEITGL